MKMKTELTQIKEIAAILLYNRIDPTLAEAEVVIGKVIGLFKLTEAQKTEAMLETLRYFMKKNKGVR